MSEPERGMTPFCIDYEFGGKRWTASFEAEGWDDAIARMEAIRSAAASLEIYEVVSAEDYLERLGDAERPEEIGATSAVLIVGEGAMEVVAREGIGG